MFTNLIVRHPYFVLISVLVFCGTCLILPFTVRKLPQFSDPQVGFETRGTLISSRLTAWSNLLDATKPSGLFAVDPRDILFTTTTEQQNKTSSIRQLHRLNKNKKNKRKKFKKDQDAPTVYVAIQKNFSDDTSAKQNEWKNRWTTIRKLSNPLKVKNLEQGQENDNNQDDPDHLHSHVSSDGFFCGTPDERYSRVVVTTTDGSNLFTYKSMMAICHIEHQLIQSDQFTTLCDTIKKHNCCHPWSIVNYVALLNNRTSCLAITDQDVTSTLKLLSSCAPYYHNLQLTHDCDNENYCNTPHECSKHNAVFNILHYLTDIGFLPPNSNGSAQTHLRQSMVFLPIGCSTKTLEYFREIEHKILEHEHVKVVAMEFGLKSALFDEYLIRDTRLLLLGFTFVFICMWIYTESLFLTFMTIIAIVFSLGISYFMYTLVFELSFFPFMNLLATIVVIGIGADDVFIFCKVWYKKKMDRSSSVVQLMTETFEHAMLSMLVTSLTTAAAFYSSLFSNITTVCCFSVFAGTAIIANFLLMLTWLPASVVISERWGCSSLLTAKCQNCDNRLRACRITIDRCWVVMEKFLLVITLRFRYFWLVSLTTTAVVSLVVVLKYPGLQLPESVDFQLFQSAHPFEQYDLYYKQRFWYERQKMDSTFSENYKLPLRFVWGVLPEDNGNYMNPYDKGTLQLDPTFDIADPLSQMWLLNFCRELRSQPFYLSALGPLLPNCFIESFLSWMQRRCIDPIDHIDRTPCCEVNPFPYERSVFEMCIVEAMSTLYETPAEYYMPGVAGPKFSRDISVPKIQAVVVEYDSSYSYSLSYIYMERFFLQVEKWTQEQMKNAPKGMRQGWFISELEFYDLQRVLSEGTLRAIGCAIGIAFVVLWLVTLNVLISLYAIFSIACSIFTTMAILVLCGWKLNVLESIAVSTAMGLAVDYSLHYGISYKLCPDNTNRQASTRQAISSMGGSTAMAALTTGAAGAFMIPSTVLAYVQIGVFLIVVMSVSWVYSTFLFNAMLSVFGPERGFGQFRYPFLNRCFSQQKANNNHGNQEESNSEPEVSTSRLHPRHKSNVLSETTLSTTSTVYAIPASESHELDSLTDRQTINDFMINHKSQCTLRYVSADHSPSATSNITIIMNEDN